MNYAHMFYKGKHSLCMCAVAVPAATLSLRMVVVARMMVGGDTARR